MVLKKHLNDPLNDDIQQTDNTDGESQLRSGFFAAVRRISNAVMLPNVSEIPIFLSQPLTKVQKERYLSRNSSDKSTSGGDETLDEGVHRPTHRDEFVSAKSSIVSKDLTIAGSNGSFENQFLYERTPPKYIMTGRGTRLTRKTMESITYPHTHTIELKAHQEASHRKGQRHSVVEYVEAFVQDAREVFHPDFSKKQKRSEHQFYWMPFASEELSQQSESTDTIDGDEEEAVPPYRRNLKDHYSKPPAQTILSPDVMFSTSTSLTNSGGFESPQEHLSPSNRGYAQRQSIFQVEPISSIAGKAADIGQVSLIIPSEVRQATAPAPKKHSVNGTISRAAHEKKKKKRTSSSNIDNVASRDSPPVKNLQIGSVFGEDVGLLCDIRFGDQNRQLLSRCILDGNFFRFPSEITRCLGGIPSEQHNRGSEMKTSICCYCNRELDPFHLRVHEWQRIMVPQYLSPSTIIYFSSPDGSKFHE